MQEIKTNGLHRTHGRCMRHHSHFKYLKRLTGPLGLKRNKKICHDGSMTS